jgi:hypothetical protein
VVVSTVKVCPVAEAVCCASVMVAWSPLGASEQDVNKIAADKMPALKNLIDFIRIFFVGYGRQK